jgi:hypothetical protein
MNRRKKFAFPCKLWIWRSVEGGGRLRIASTFKGYTQIPCIDTIKPRSRPDSTQKHICVDSNVCDNNDNVGKWHVNVSGDLDDAWNAQVDRLYRVV